ncbi:MAG: hypothetical protein AB7F31_07540 [Parachlamydiales bacterium]
MASLVDFRPQSLKFSQIGRSSKLFYDFQSRNDKEKEEIIHNKIQDTYNAGYRFNNTLSLHPLVFDTPILQSEGDAFWYHLGPVIPFSTKDLEGRPQNRVDRFKEAVLPYLRKGALLEDIGTGNGARMIELLLAAFSTYPNARFGLVGTDINLGNLTYATALSHHLEMDSYCLWAHGNANEGPITDGYPNKLVLTSSLFTHLLSPKDLLRFLPKLGSALGPDDRAVVEVRLQGRGGELGKNFKHLLDCGDVTASAISGMVKAKEYVPGNFIDQEFLSSVLQISGLGIEKNIPLDDDRSHWDLLILKKQ